MLHLYASKNYKNFCLALWEDFQAVLCLLSTAKLILFRITFVVLLAIARAGKDSKRMVCQ